MIYCKRPRLQTLAITKDPENLFSAQANQYSCPSELIAEAFDWFAYYCPFAIPERYSDNEIEAALVEELGGLDTSYFSRLPNSYRLYIELKY